MKAWRQLTIRARITVGSLVVAAVIGAIGLVGVRVQVASILQSADVTLAEADLSAFETAISTDQLNELETPTDGSLVFVRAPDGEVRVDTLPHDIHEEVEHRAGRSETTTAVLEDVPYTIVGRTVDTSTGTWSLWSARSSEASALALEGLDHILLSGAAVMLALFAGASWLLASAALRPVERMRAEAAVLGATGTERLAVGPAHDELADLAVTLNGFLDRVRDSAEREKQMVSDASHELRTPLAALRTQLELAHGDFGDAEALVRHVLAAEQSVNRLASLASGLLALSRLEASGNRTSASGAQELESELMDSVDRARILAVSDSVDVSHSIGVLSPTIHVAVGRTDFGRLVDNLLSNAVAAVGASGWVKVSLEEHNDDLRLKVADSGPGLPEEFIPVAFDRFTRPDDSRTSATGGTGLGLALVQAIAHSAGGSARLANGPSGLIVTVTFPKM